MFKSWSTNKSPSQTESMTRGCHNLLCIHTKFVHKFSESLTFLKTWKISFEPFEQILCGKILKVAHKGFPLRLRIASFLSVKHHSIEFSIVSKTVFVRKIESEYRSTFVNSLQSPIASTCSEQLNMASLSPNDSDQLLVPAGRPPWPNSGLSVGPHFLNSSWSFTLYYLKGSKVPLPSPAPNIKGP